MTQVVESNNQIVAITLRRYLGKLQAHPHASNPNLVVGRAIREVESLLRESAIPATGPAKRPRVPNLAASLAASAALYGIRLAETLVREVERHKARCIGHDLLAIAMGLDSPSYIGYYWISREVNKVSFTD